MYSTKKKTIEEVKEYAKQFRYECLSNKYVNAHTKLRFRCGRGHIFEAEWASFQQGIRCPYCAGVKKKTIEEINRYAKQFEYECLSKEYKNNYTELEFQCNKNHIFEMTWHNFQQGQRCPICFGNKKKTIEEIKVYAKRFGYKCLSNKYKNAHTELEFQCDEGHIYEAEWNNFQQGERCPICNHLNQFGENHPNWKNYSEEELQKLEGYRADIVKLSNINFRKYHHLIDPKRLRGDENHLDHIYTVIDGFNNNIPPEVIASPINLQMLTAFDNMSKNGRSDMTKEMLYKLYNQFKKE